MRERNFNRLLKVLYREKIDEPVLFEYILNDNLYNHLAGYTLQKNPTEKERFTHLTKAFAAAGYDYVFFNPLSFNFTYSFGPKDKSMSLNECTIINDWESFRNYPWPDPAIADYSVFNEVKPILIDKMKIILRAPNGMLANLMYFFGYDNLCYLIYDDPKLIKAVSDAIGERLLEYYRLCMPNENIGALMYNDDWGFHTGPLFPPDFFEKYVFPWVKKFTDVAHSYGKPAMIHSCGNLGIIMDSIIDDLKFDGKHSFEDKIMPIETAYKIYSNRIALLGGIDMDFVCRASKEEIFNRSKNMLAMGKTGYALGTGNSVPYFVPTENFFTMISAAGL